jgi:diadenosine tetraphosphate (Ap4A) HIT family hydrolase
MANLLKPSSKSIIYDDENLYVCLAKYPITKGHCVIVWKEPARDLNLMPDRSYDYLMDTVFATRDALLKTLKIKKVYMVYMDETNHVHFHLVPRYKEKGFSVFQKKPEILKDFSLAKKIKKNLIFK